MYMLYVNKFEKLFKLSENKIETQSSKIVQKYYSNMLGNVLIQLISLCPRK